MRYEFEGLTHADLGEIMLREISDVTCHEAYGTTDPALVGRLALGYGDINPDGTLN